MQGRTQLRAWADGRAHVHPITYEKIVVAIIYIDFVIRSDPNTGTLID